MTATDDLAHAACAGMPTELWFPKKEAGRDNHGTEAKAVCAQCPALVACLEGALERNESEGIWGGAGGDEMRNLRRAWVRGRTFPEYWQQALLRHIARLDGDGELVDRNGPGATHGLRATYNRGCRCKSCEWAAVDDVAEHRERPLLPAAIDQIPSYRPAFVGAAFDHCQMGCECRVCEISNDDLWELTA